MRKMRMKDGNTHLKISSMSSLKSFTFHHVFFFKKKIKRQRLNMKSKQSQSTEFIPGLARFEPVYREEEDAFSLW